MTQPNGFYTDEELYDTYMMMDFGRELDMPAFVNTVVMLMDRVKTLECQVAELKASRPDL